MTVTIEDVVDALVSDVVVDYRIEADDARTLIAALARRDRGLIGIIASAKSLDQVRRTRAFKNARQNARKTVYHLLRRYKRESPGETIDDLAAQLRTVQPGCASEVTTRILLSHSSTRERLPSRNEFDAALTTMLGKPRTILDIGCGVYPLMFPFGSVGRDLTSYIAADEDEAVLSAVEAFAVHAPIRITALRFALSDGWDALLRNAGLPPHQRFDVALMLKIVPVVARQEPELLPILAAVPARKVIATGSRVALAKRATIERRERGVLRRFAATTKGRVSSEFAVGEEIGLVIELD